MNLKKSISLMLASAAISTAISGAVSAIGKPFGNGNCLMAHQVSRRGTSNSDQLRDELHYNLPQRSNSINFSGMHVGDERYVMFELCNPAQVNNGNSDEARLVALEEALREGRILGISTLRNDSQTFSDYAVEVYFNGAKNAFGYLMPPRIVYSPGVTGVVDIESIETSEHGLAVRFRATGAGSANGEIRIKSNSSNLTLTIPFHCEIKIASSTASGRISILKSVRALEFNQLCGGNWYQAYQL